MAAMTYLLFDSQLGRITLPLRFKVWKTPTGITVMRAQPSDPLSDRLYFYRENNYPKLPDDWYEPFTAIQSTAALVWAERLNDYQPDSTKRIPKQYD